MLSIIYLVVFANSALCSNLEHMLNLEDILRTDLMPSSLMMIEGSVDQQKDVKNNKTNDIASLSSNGSWNEAFATMGFHRYV